MKIAVTGADGFIGINFLSYNQDHEIVKVDLLNQTLNDYSFKGINVILHLAALVHQTGKIDDNTFFQVNSNLTIELARKAKSQGVQHFIFMSTVKVYGEYNTIYQPWKEDTDCYPSDPYGRSKLDAEKRLRKLEENYFHVTIIRTPVVYGPGVKGNILKLMEFIDRAFIIPLGNINNIRSMIYVGNLCAYLQNVIENKTSGILIVKDVEEYGTSDLVFEMNKRLDQKKIISIPVFIQYLIKLLIPSYFSKIFGSLILENSATKNKTKIQVPYTFKDGIESTINWYKNR